MEEANILSSLCQKITILDLNTGEEIAVITDDAITTASEKIVVKITPVYA